MALKLSKEEFESLDLRKGIARKLDEFKRIEDAATWAHIRRIDRAIAIERRLPCPREAGIAKLLEQKGQLLAALGVPNNIETTRGSKA